MDLNDNEEIRHFHDDDIWLQLPEFISFLVFLFKFVNPADVIVQLS